MELLALQTLVAVAVAVVVAVQVEQVVQVLLLFDIAVTLQAQHLQLAPQHFLQMVSINIIDSLHLDQLHSKD
jgi:hypothetical protein